MNKSRFRIVTLLITVSLAALAVLQLFSLRRMYSDMGMRFAQTVTSAMERSAYEELASRGYEGSVSQSLMPDIPVGSISSVNIKKGEGDTVDISTLLSDDEAKKVIESMRGKGISMSVSGIHKIEDSVNGGYVLRDSRDSAGTGGSVAFSIRASGIDSLYRSGTTVITSARAAQMRDSLRNSSAADSVNVIIDIMGTGRLGARQSYRFISTYYSDASLDPGQFARYDSLLTSNLLMAGVVAPHKSSLVNSKDDKTIYHKGGDIENPVRFDMPLGADGKMLCRVELPDPNNGFLREMSWVIASSVLIMLLLCFAFIYLLRTMFRQKSVEEMRMDFTHNITHELKTPIAVAYAAGDALLNFGADSDPQRRVEYLQIMQDQLDNLSGMVERILSMSVENGETFRPQREPVALKPLLESLLENYRLKSEKPVRFSLDVVPAALTVNADRFHMTNILGSLVDNAVKYSGAEVLVNIKAAHAGNAVVITVEDNGIGIPASAQGRIFDKYYRVPTGNLHDVKGFGLGLYYARAVVEGHGGTIGVRSREGGGTKFTITILDDGR